MWKEMVILKSEQFMDTEKVKSMKFKTRGWSRYFDIDEFEPIRIEHIQSLILYTDFTKLSQSFTSTFRRLYENEPLESVKNRNCSYYWMSKLLIEIITGYSEMPSTASEELYCGLNKALYIPNGNIHLRGPVSTSKEFAIAINYSTNDDVILELTGRYQPRFHVSWLSRYIEEDEVIFIHGEYPMRLVSVRLHPIATQEWINYQSFCKILCQIDEACDGGSMFNGTETKKDASILSSLDLSSGCVNTKLH